METTQSFEQIFGLAGNSLFSLGDVFVAMALTTLNVLILSLAYRKTHHGPNYSRTFMATLFVVSVATSIVMLIIGSNIARAFSLVGALSIIRFRTAVKDPRDTAFIFAGIVAGMGCGTGFFAPVFFMVLFISILLVLLDKYDFGLKNDLDGILKITVNADADAKSLEDALKVSFKKLQLINKLQDFTNQSSTLVYIMRSASPKELAEAENTAQKYDFVKEISTYHTDQHAPF